MLVEKHPDRYSAHIKAVQKILHVLAGDGVCAIGLFVLHNTLGHGRHDIVVSVTNLYDSICEPDTEESVKKCVCMEQNIDMSVQILMSLLTHM